MFNKLNKLWRKSDTQSDSTKPSPESPANNDIEYIYTCIFNDESKAKAFSAVLSEMGYPNNIMPMTHQQSWWVKHQTTAGAQEKLDALRELLNTLVLEHGGKLGPITTGDADATIQINL